MHKEVISNNPALVDFAIGLVNSVLNLPKRLGKLNYTSTFRKTVKFLINSCGLKAVFQAHLTK